MFIEYYSGDIGGVCNHDNDIIRSKHECSKALSELNFNVSGKFWRGSGAPMPSGCSMRSGGDKRPHLLISATGVGTGRNDLIPICKSGLDTGTISIFISYWKRIIVSMRRKFIIIMKLLNFIFQFKYL